MTHREGNRSFKEKYKIYFAAGITAWIIFMFIHPIGITGDAMSPTLEEGQIAIVSKENFSREAPRVFSVVNFQHDFSNEGEKNSNKVRRVVGIPGDTIEIVDNILYVNGIEQNEPYARIDPFEKMVINRNLQKIDVQAGQLFVMGDNRGHSMDSRDFGVINRSWVEGKAVFRIIPFSKFGNLE